MAILGIIFYTCTIIFALPIITMQKQSHGFAAHETLFAFDIDGVILANRTKAYKKWLAEHPDFETAFNRTKKEKKLTDWFQITDVLANENPTLETQAQEFKKVITKADRIEGITEILQKISNKGYTIISASNMTTGVYHAMVDNKTLPNEFFTKDFFFIKTHPLNKKEEGYFGKPHETYFRNLMRYVEQKYPGKFKNFILADDKLENITGAKAAGLQSIHFQNAQQFMNELKALGIALD